MTFLAIREPRGQGNIVGGRWPVFHFTRLYPISNKNL